MSENVEHDSVDITIAKFLSRLKQEGKLPTAVQIRLRQLAEASQLANEPSLEKAIRAESEVANETQAPGSESSSRTP